MSNNAEGWSRGSRSITTSILALVVGAVLVSAVMVFLVTFSGPPPMAGPVMLGEIADELRGEHRSIDHFDDRAPRPPGPGRGGPMGRRLFGDDGPRLVITRQRVAPAEGDGKARLPALEAAVATMLQTAPDRVVAMSDQQAPPSFEARDIRGDFTVGWHVADGWRVARPAPRPFLTAWHKATIVAMLVAITALAVPAWFIARAITRPLRQLSRAAELARAGATRPDFPLDGPAEVRALTAAVADMHDRLTHHAEQRTAMLAAIAHDLGTPLSRLAFWIEQLPDTARDHAAGDIDEMRAMISDTLGFARDEAGERDSQRVDLTSLLDSLVEDMRVGGAAAALVIGERALVRGDPRSFRRLFANLIGNALRYAGNATVSWTVDVASVIVRVEDDGPGIDPAQAERLFEPFVRGDPSRNRATGGTGLGLAIVRAIAARHNGRVTLANRPTGGAVAIVRLPLAS